MLSPTEPKPALPTTFHEGVEAPVTVGVAVAVLVDVKVGVEVAV